MKYAKEEGASVYSFDVESSAGKCIIKKLRTNLISKKPKRKLLRRQVNNADIAEIRDYVLETAKEGIDLFFHDSDHRYENAKWEYDNITHYMKKGSPIILHDILHKSAEHETHRLFDEINCSWKHVFQTPNGLGIIVL